MTGATARATVRATAEHWPLARPFTIARGRKTAADVVVVTVTAGGVRGRGECVPYPRYGESTDSVLAAIDAYAGAVAGHLDRERLRQDMPAGAARNALDCALWDLEAKRAGKPVSVLAGVEAPRPVVTAETISIGSPDEMAAAAASSARSPLLKVKLDGSDIGVRMRAVRAAAPKARLIVDANEGWSLDDLSEHAPLLADIGVELIEQPLPAADDAALAEFASPVPLCADESCHTAADIPALRERYQLVNIKLDKAGGVTEALDAARAARALGLGVVVGCMVGTSLAMAPALLLAGLADVVDLDGPLWLANDREHALGFVNGLIHPPDPALWG